MALPHIGIDLGTTNTVMAACQKRDSDIFVDILPIHQTERLGGFSTQEKYLPSVLYFGNRVFVGEYARYMKSNNIDDIIYNSKLSIGTRNILKNNYTPIMAAVEIMKTCKASLLKRYNVNSIGLFDSVTVTVPASFDTNQINDTIEAVKAAGFVNARTLEEPAAVLLYFLKSQQNNIFSEKINLSDKNRILVYDIGGGTTDVCIADIQILNLDQLSVSINFLATGRFIEFGGNDFDEIIATTLLNNFFIKNSVDKNDINENEKNKMVYKLIPFCENVKQFFSSEVEQGNPYEFTIYRFYKENEASFSVNYNDFISIIEPLLIDRRLERPIDFKRNIPIKNILHPIKYAINKLYEETHSQDHHIDYILMTGGMSMLQIVKERIREEFGIPIITIDRPMDAVALGAALYSYWKLTITNQETRDTSGHEKIEGENPEQSYEPELNTVSKDPIENIEIKTRALLNEAIFIDLYDSLPLEIIGAQTPIPIEGTLNDNFTIKSPTGFIINLLAGQNVYDPEMRFLYSYGFEFPTTVKKGTEARISYSIDENRYLKITIIVMAETKMVFPLEVSLD